jgi:hypothetical protein
MWTVLAPLLIFVVVLLFQLGKTKENFVTDASGNVVDASGNLVDASGNIIDASGSKVSTSTPNNIQLTLSDLLKLFKAATPAPIETKATTINDAIQKVVATSPDSSAQLYEKLRPSVLQDIKSQLQGAPFVPADPIPSDAGCDMSSDSIAQGAELMNARGNLENNADYIRKDSIPCYGCSL